MTTAQTHKLATGDFQGYVSFMAAEVDVNTQRLKQVNASRSIAGLRGSFRGGRRGFVRGRSRGNCTETSNLEPTLSATVDRNLWKSSAIHIRNFKTSTQISEQDYGTPYRKEIQSFIPAHNTR